MISNHWGAHKSVYDISLPFACFNTKCNFIKHYMDKFAIKILSLQPTCEVPGLEEWTM